MAGALGAPARVRRKRVRREEDECSSALHVFQVCVPNTEMTKPVATLVEKTVGEEIPSTVIFPEIPTSAKYI